MGEQVHGHEVMRMMLATGETYTRSSLRAAIVERFGAAARFHTCSAEGMTAEELIAFLEKRGKFIARDGGFSTLPERVCGHE